VDIEQKQLSKIGFEFEFFCELNNNELKTKLTKLLNKKIVISDQYHSDVQVTENQFKIEPDFSTGMSGKELVTGPVSYDEGKVILEKVCNFIRRYGSTSKKTAIHLNLSFKKDLIESLKHSFNTVKFILEFDEEEIYEDWPERRNSLYAKSIKHLKPIDKNFVFAKNSFNRHTLSYPIEKYRGVNFTKLVSDYLEVRYIGVIIMNL